MPLPADTKPERSVLRRWLEGFQGFAGGFLMYIMVGGLAGFALASRHGEETTCLPIHTAFAQITSRCSENAVNIFWAITLAAPRSLITPPALAIAYYKGGLASNTFLLVDTNIWLHYSIPMLILLWAGTVFWWKLHRGAAAILFALIVGQ